MNAMRLTGSAPSLRQHTITAPVPAWRHPSHVVLETCVEDVEGVRISARAGADRAELGANLTAAGTTPSIGTIEAAIFAAAEQVEQRRAQAGAHWAEKPEAAAPFGLRILIRPRGGSFVYDADEGRAMIADVRRIATLALEMAEFTRPQATGGGRTTLPPAVDLGFVVGALTEDGTIDRGLVRLLVDMANGAPVTFHRAFDQCRDTVEAYGDLEGLGVRYVLTSGAAQTAADGASVIAGLVASGGPTVVAAGAVRPDGLVDLVESTGVREVHMRCPREGLTPDEPQRTDEALVRRAVETVRAVPLRPVRLGAPTRPGVPVTLLGPWSPVRVPMLPENPHGSSLSTVLAATSGSDASVTLEAQSEELPMHPPCSPLFSVLG